MEFIVFLVVLVSLILVIRWTIKGNWRNIKMEDYIKDYQPPQPYDLYGFPDPNDVMPVVYPDEELEVKEKSDNTKNTKRQVYHVVPYKGNDERDWAIKKRRKVIETYSRKADAVANARLLAKSHDKGQLVIHKRDGTIQEERTYGADPRKSKG